MPICITCSHPVKNLYTTYSKADDRSLGKGVRLTQCPNCKRFADKYVEHDYVVLFIDLVLIKPQVYRHLLFNRLQQSTSLKARSTLNPSILRLGILLILFDVYITWARIERVNSPSSSSSSSTNAVSATNNNSNFSSAPIITQYLFFLTLNIVSTVVQHIVIRSLARVLLRDRGSRNDGAETTKTNASSHQEPTSKIQHIRSSSSPSKISRGTQRQSPNLHTGMIQTSVSTPGLDTHTENNNNNHNASITRTTLSTSSITTVANASQSHPALHQTAYSPSSTTQADASALVDINTLGQTGATITTTTSNTPDTFGPGPSATPSAISTALLVSSCTKLFPILLVIWPTSVSSSPSSSSPSAATELFQTSPQPSSASLLSSSSSSSSPPSLPSFAHRATSYIGWVVLVNNIEALLILLDCGYAVATALAVAGLLGRWVVEGWMLSAVGLVRELEGPVGDVLGLLVGWRGRG